MQIANPDDFNQTSQSNMDATLLVRFYSKPRENKIESAKEGRPIFHDVDYIEIRTPGSRDAVARPASAGDIARFPKHYEAYKNRTSQEVNDGTPLAEWPGVTRSQAEELAFFNVKTVEQLAGMPDNHATGFMGIHALKRKANEWIDQAKENAKAAELKAELAKRDEEIRELRAAVEELRNAKPPLRKKVGKKKVTRKKVVAKKE